MLITENNPRAYVSRIVKDVLNTPNISKENKDYVSLNKKLKSIDSKIVDLKGDICSPETFINQSMQYFDETFPKYKIWRNTMLRAVKDYVITESYFNY